MSKYQAFKKLCVELDHFPLASELIYKFGFSIQEINEISRDKHGDDEFVKLSLVDHAGKPLIYWNDSKIIAHFLGSQDLIQNSTMRNMADFQDSELLNRFVFSEVESSLAIEGVRSTRAKIEQLQRAAYEDLHERNDIIVKNMLLGFEFVKGHEITKENIFELYQMLSKNCLDERDRLAPGTFYRHDAVNIIDSNGAVVDKGVDWILLPRLMDDLLAYIKKEKTYEEHLIASHIIHYYMIYLHPYFDYNGRMARVMSFWYNFRNAPSLSLLLISEGINNKAHKKGYFNAIMNSRSAGNDITFFLEYMGKIMLAFAKIYINFYALQAKLKGDGLLLNRAQEIALKYVLALPTSGAGYFSWKDYHEYSHDEFSKQYYLRLLNSLVDLDILDAKEQKATKLFRLNLDKWNLLR